MNNLLFLFIVFIPLLDFRISGFGYWDEMIFFIIIAIGALSLDVRSGMLRIRSFQLKQYAIVLTLVVLGVCGNLFHPGIQSSNIVMLKDVLALIKFPITMIFLSTMDYSKYQGKITHGAAKICKILLIIMAIFALIGYFVNMGVYTSEVRFVKCYKFFFQHPTFYVFSCVMILAVLVTDSIKKNRGYLLLNCLLIFMAQRTKGYLVIVLLLAIILFGESRLSKLFNRINGKTKIKRKYVVIVCAVVIAVGWVIGKSKLISYMSWGLTAARPALYLVGLQIASDMFPFGSGFGTFASYLSGESYSNIYSMYGISGVWGITQEKYNYISDTFWPYIYGQFGYFGLLAYVFLIFGIIKNQFSKISNYNRIIAFFIIWVYAIFASGAEAFFTNGTGIQMAIILGVFIGVDNKKAL